jgi:NTE family protein
VFTSIRFQPLCLPVFFLGGSRFATSIDVFTTEVNTMHLRSGVFTTVFCCWLLASASPSVAQLPGPIASSNAAMSERPSLGLVLEGGGALGLAHIGVIQWMEEHRIPVNYIAGTSMGGLVGGVYATGRNAGELHDVVEGIQWNQVINGQIPFDNLSFRRKQDAREYPAKVELGLKKGLQFPSGFNSGQEVSLILDRIALPYSDIRSFDELPIPFACVATDLVTSSEHVFRSGPLDLALRSTMSLPGIFSPVRSGGHIYVDGGLLNNFPVSVAKAMGARYVLGIHLETAPLNPDGSLSSFAVLGRSIETVVAANERRAMEDADMVVTVNLRKYNSMDFNAGEKIIKAGYAAAAANTEKLSLLSVDEATWQQYLAERYARRRNAEVPQFLAVTGVPPQTGDPITKDLSGLVGKPVDTAKLDHDIRQLTGTGSLSVVNYSMIEKNGEPGLQLQAEEKGYSAIIRPLISINGASYDNVFFSIGGRITFLNFGGYRRELRTDVIFGSQYGLGIEYYRPFTGTSDWFVAPRAIYNNAQFPLFNGNNFLALYRNRVALGGLDVGYGFGKIGELRFGYEGGYQKLKPQIGRSTALPTVAGPTGDVRLQYILTTVDHPVVPRCGENIRFYTDYFNENPGAPHGFPLSDLQVQNFFRLSDPSSVFLNAYGGTSYGFKTGIPPFDLGGVTRFVAFGTNELLTNQYFLFQTGYIRKLKNLPPLLGSTIDALGMFEIGKTYQPPFKLPGDVAGALIVNTIFGPVEVGGAVGDYGHAKFFFQVGRIF